MLLNGPGKFIKKRGDRLKTLLVCLLLSITLVLSGCELFQKEQEVSPDERSGRNLIIYFADDSSARHAAQAIAKKTGGELFDIAGKNPLPNLLDYDTFFVGASLAEPPADIPAKLSVEGRIPQALAAFLAETDFIDGRVIPFWIGEALPNLNGEFEQLLHGARFLPGGGFLFTRRTKTKDIEETAGAWAEDRLGELGLRKAAGGDQAEDMAKLFAAAYPERLSAAAFQDGDWTLEMDEVRWYYAQGRFLPQADAEKPENFRPQFLYRYFAEPTQSSVKLNPWRTKANQILSRRQSSASYRTSRFYSNSGALRSPFVETLWQAGDREKAFAQQKWIEFLGWSVQIHQGIAAPLGRVEEDIRTLAETDPEIQGWRKNLHSITGWNWRNVAGSESRSFHSYGIAVDLLMKAEADMETYWQWTAAKGIDWHNVPAEKRQNPPSSVIRIFEEQGFIWGGRWARYDTMHFEYHPELLILGAFGY
jgi:flavodoxin